MKKIIMVEDNQDHALLIRRGVEGSDCSIIHYDEGLEALKFFDQIKSYEDRPDLVLLDLQLPGTSGFDILKSIRKNDSLLYVPVVMLTTSSRTAEIQTAYQLGANGFVVKSDDFALLMTKLKSVKDYWLSVAESPYPSLSTTRHQ